MVREAAATIAIPRLAQVAAKGSDADAVRAAAVILDKALPRQISPKDDEDDQVEWYVALPRKARTTREWVKMHGIKLPPGHKLKGELEKPTLGAPDSFTTSTSPSGKPYGKAPRNGNGHKQIE